MLASTLLQRIDSLVEDALRLVQELHLVLIVMSSLATSQTNFFAGGTALEQIVHVGPVVRLLGRI